MEELANELLSFIFDFVPEESLELRNVCDDWDHVITKFYNIGEIRNLKTLKEIFNVFYRSKLNVRGEIFLDYIRYVHTLDLWCWEKVEDVSALGNVHTLHLKGLDVDVSMLKNVKIIR